MMFLELQNSTRFASVLDEHWERLSKFTWHENANESTVRRKIQSTSSYQGDGKPATEFISLANEVMQTRGIMYDHKNRDYLRNIPENLRPCTQSQNVMNSSKRRGCSSNHKGVSWSKRYSNWRSYIVKDNIQYHLGYFEFESDAALAYNKAAHKMFGEFAVLNII